LETPLESGDLWVGFKNTVQGDGAAAVSDAVLFGYDENTTTITDRGWHWLIGDTSWHNAYDMMSGVYMIRATVVTY